ncbi:MAG: TonB-dependent receptor, partial [Cyclobacteriaceae bacterium]
DTVMRTQELEVQRVAEYLDNEFTQTKYTYNTSLNTKLNAKNTISTGLIADLYQMDLLRTLTWQRGQTALAVNEVNYQGNTMLWQGYVSWQHKFNHRLLMNSGLHYQNLTLNENSRVFEPRLGLQYNLNAANTVSLAYGRHSQMQGLQVYFVETKLPDGRQVQTNRNLGFTTSDHYVLAYDWMIAPSLRLKAETYYQNIFNVPVTTRPSHFSMLNAGADFFLPDEDSLVNNGTGYNQGIELTLEKFFSNSYYFLVTGSFFDSKYTGSDGIERNTVFNGNFVINGLLGKEWPIGKKNNIIAVDMKFTTAGNRRYIPIDLEASQAAGQAVYQDEQAYENRFKDYLRADLKLTFRKEHKKFTEEYVLDIQNVTNNQNVFMQRYNSLTGTLGNTYQLGIWPLIQYRITF